MDDPSPETDWLATAAVATPDAVALVEDDGTRVTYAELDDLAARAVGQLHQAFGLAPTGLMGFAPFRVQRRVLAGMWATWRLGAAVMVADPHSPMLIGGADGIRTKWGIPELIADLEIFGEPSRPPTAPGRGQLHTVLLTSGSGGSPRPVRLTHGNVAAAVAASSERLGNSGADRWLLNLPLHHIGGLSVLWRSAWAGGTVVVHDSFDATRAAKAMKHGGVTVASLVPTMLHRILEADPGPYEGMKAVLLGGAAASVSLVERALDAGLPVLQTYGMTETCSQATTVEPGAARESIGTAGTPLRGMSVTIDGQGLGEILVDGPAVSPGYLGEPDRTGPHRTGDVGSIDAEGRLVVKGRIDDMIVTGGENVYPAAVAEVIGRHPVVKRVEVVGVPDPEWGNLVGAVLVADADAIQEIEEWARLQLARHEVPKRWVFVTEMPLLENGKVDRGRVGELARGLR
ncbi:MAG: AMP-binding protein [Acidimicrobiia bacterium]|nr:AMP-binding protein [Acidimicrobiia bacterium]